MRRELRARERAAVSYWRDGSREHEEVRISVDGKAHVRFWRIVEIETQLVASAALDWESGRERGVEARGADDSIVLPLYTIFANNTLLGHLGDSIFEGSGVGSLEGRYECIAGCGASAADAEGRCHKGGKFFVGEYVFVMIQSPLFDCRLHFRAFVEHAPATVKVRLNSFAIAAEEFRIRIETSPFLVGVLTELVRPSSE